MTMTILKKCMGFAMFLEWSMERDPGTFQKNLRYDLVTKDRLL